MGVFVSGRCLVESEPGLAQALEQCVVGDGGEEFLDGADGGTIFESVQREQRLGGSEEHGWCPL
jgi:hypothetical protein